MQSHRVKPSILLQWAWPEYYRDDLRGTVHNGEDRFGMVRVRWDGRRKVLSYFLDEIEYVQEES